MLEKFLTPKNGIRTLITGVLMIFISFIFMPGNVKPGTELSPVPYIMFIGGEILAFLGVVIIIGSILLKILYE